MEYVRLGTTGVMVSPLCLGTMMFGGWGNPDHDDCVRIMHSALDRGINFWDTANVYSQGESEEVVAKALKGRRDEVFLATKFHFPMGEGPNDRGNSRLSIFRAVEESLRRLGVDHIDLYQVHRPDPFTDIAETLGAMTDLVRQGKVRHIGSTTFGAHDTVEAQEVAAERRLDRFVTEQPPYSILVREIEKAVLPTCTKYRMGVLVWSPLAGGWLAGKYRPEHPSSAHPVRAERIPARFDPKIPGNRRKAEAVEKLIVVAEQAGLSMVQMAIAWTLEHPAVTCSIIGPRTMEQLHQQLPAADLRLPAEVLDAIDEIVTPGVTLNPADNGYTSPFLMAEHRRRA